MEVSNHPADANAQGGHAAPALGEVPVPVTRSEHPSAATVQGSSIAAETDKHADIGGLVTMPILMIMALGFVFAISGVAACFVLADDRTRAPHDRVAAFIALANLLGLIALIAAIVR